MRDLCPLLNSYGGMTSISSRFFFFLRNDLEKSPTMKCIKQNYSMEITFVGTFYISEHSTHKKKTMINRIFIYTVQSRQNYYYK